MKHPNGTHKSLSAYLLILSMLAGPAVGVPQARDEVFSDKYGRNALLAPVTTTVTNTNDSGAGCLRQAITDATPGSTIIFDAAVFATPRTITLTSGQLVIDKDLTILGPGAGLLSISGNHTSRVFGIDAGVAATLDGLTIKDGSLGLPPSVGGGILNRGVLTVRNSTITGNIGEAYAIYTDGAGIFNDTSGTLNLSKSIVSANLSNDPDGNSTGGGIHNRGVMTITDSTVSDNVSNSGGGICNYGTMTVANSTISRNTIINGGGGGGGIFNWDPLQRGVTLTVINSTISDNAAGGIVSYLDVCCPASSESLKNTIVAGNTGGDIEGTIEMASHNLIGSASSSSGIQNGVDGNIVGVNPLIGPLQDNGGRTMTQALLPGSPAINAGNNCVLTANGCGFPHPALTSDQRGTGFSRLVSGTVDIGAFEVQTTISASVSGRVTTPSGQGLRNATVWITDPSGVNRTATTSTFGFYSFNSIPAGQTYTISIASRRYRFTPITLVINENLTDVDFVGQE